MENIACVRSGRLGASLAPLPKKQEEDLLRLPPQKPNKPQNEGKALPPPPLKPKRAAPPLPSKKSPSELLPPMKPAKPVKPVKPAMPAKPMRPAKPVPASEEMNEFAW